jgi:hypothetical protein
MTPVPTATAELHPEAISPMKTKRPWGIKPNSHSGLLDFDDLQNVIKVFNIFNVCSYESSAMRMRRCRNHEVKTASS